MKQKSTFFYLVLPAVLLLTVSASAQTVLYEENFNSVARAERPTGWTFIPGWMHCPSPQPTGDSVHADGIPESADWATTGNPEVDWQVTEIKRVSMYDATRGTDGVRDYWGKYTIDPLGEPIPDGLVSGSMPSTDQFYWAAPDPSTAVARTRAGGSTAPWVTFPYPNFGCDPTTGVIDENAKVLIADSDEYGGVNMNSAISTPAVQLKGAKYVRVSFKYMVEQNQDSESACYVKLDNKPWETLQRFSMHYHGDDYNYLADISYVVKTEGASTLQCLFYYQGNFSWEYVIDDFKVTSYSDVPADGPAQPQALSPTGTINVGEAVTLKASAYSGAKAHAFSQWQIRDDEGTYGQLTAFTDSSFSELYPVVDTGVQPNHYANGAVVTRVGGVWSGNLVLGKPNPATQLSVPIGEGFGDKTQQVIPADMLRAGVTYHWRVRYWDTDYKSSAWSDEQTLTVRAIPGNTLYSENFDNIADPDKSIVVPKGWDGLFDYTGWYVSSLGVFQLFGNNPANGNAIVNGTVTAGLSAPNSTEPDGRGHHGRFRGNVLVDDAGSSNDATTPQINNSGSTQPLYLLFDAQIRASNDNVAFAVDMKDDAGVVTQVYSFSNVSANYANEVMSGRINPVVYTISPTIKIDAAAGKKVNFTFYNSENDGGDDWVALDNIQVVQYNASAPIENWELQ